MVKPNWYSPLKGGFTDAATLETLLAILPGKPIIIEGYSIDRQNGQAVYRVKGEKVDWRWLLRNPDLSWVQEEDNLDTMRTQDKWFRDNYGLTDVMERYGCEYLSVTEETLSGRVVEVDAVKRRVEANYPPVEYPKLYGYMPERLAAYVGAPLISFGHVKGAGGTFPSLSIKNLFGLIPDPWRSWWHGPGETRINRSIVDIAKIYASYFSLVGVCESFNCYTVSDQYGEVKAPWGAYRVEDGDGFAACGDNLAELDSVLCGLIKVDPLKVGYLRESEAVFGAYDVKAVTKASTCSPHWFPKI